VISAVPIHYDDVLAAGEISSSEDRFFILQGDVIQTEAAYFRGDSVTGGPLFAVMNSTGDLVPGRRHFASLLRVTPVGPLLAGG
jgi:hypothetical protein